MPSAGRFAGGGTEKWATDTNHDASCFLIAQAMASASLWVVWWFVGTKRYMSSRHRYGGCLKRAAYRSGSHRSTNIIFDCGPNSRQAFWGASVQARGTDDPAALWTVLNVEALLHDREPGEVLGVGLIHWNGGRRP